MALLYNNSNVNATATVFNPVNGDTGSASIIVNSPGTGTPPSFVITGSIPTFGSVSNPNNLIINDNVGNVANVLANTWLAGSWQNGLSRLSNTGLTFQTAQSGTGYPFVTFSTINAGAGTGTVAVNCTTINGAQPVQAGRYTFASPGTNTVTLATPYSSISTFSVTANGTSATAPVAVATTSPSTFTLTYTGTGVVNWMTSGVSQ